RAENGQRRSHNHNNVNEDTERIVVDQIVIRYAGKQAGPVHGRKTEKCSDERDPAEDALVRGANERVDDHDDDAEQAQMHFRGEPVEVDELTGHHCAARLSTSAATAAPST